MQFLLEEPVDAGERLSGMNNSALAGDRSLVPSTDIGQLTTLSTQAPRTQAPFSRLQKYLYIGIQIIK